MKHVLCGVLAALLCASAWAIDPQPFDSPEQEQRFQNLIAELRCLVCQNQNLADSNAELARDLRDEVLDLMKQGLSDDEIKTFLTTRYSDFVLYRPPVNATTSLLWFGPLVLVGVGAITLLVILRKRASMPIEDADADLFDEEQGNLDDKPSA